MQINSSSVTNTTKQINACIQNIDNELKKMNAVLDIVASAWQGEDSVAFVNASKNKLLVDFTNLSAEIKKYSDFLGKVPGAYQTLDENFSKKINI